MNRQTKTMDGNQAAAHVAYAYTEAAAIYPITPSSPMAEYAEQWMAQGRKNIFGRPLLLREMQSEAGAAGAVHGALTAGALASTFTASQGLLLMLPNLYRIAGELLPGVFHVAARTIATHALSIFGDHSDIYACRQTGAAIWAEGSVQEVMDLSPLAHITALEGSIPFINFFDGFRTSHELQKIAVWDYEDLAQLFSGEAREALQRFRENCLHPSHGILRGTAQNPDVFFQVREAANPLYDALPGLAERNLALINDRLDTDYRLFNYYGAPDASHVVVAMGSVCETIREYLESRECRARENNRGEKYGLVAVHLYRPFSAAHLLAALPPDTRRITVLSRTKEPGAIGEPLYLDVLAALKDSAFSRIPVFSGRYGLSSKDTTPAQIAAVFENREKTVFTIGITDDVTHLSLPEPLLPDTAAKGTLSCKFWGLGGDGTVSATKNIIKIVGDNSGLQVQGYFEYDSKKSRGLTISHLRFGNAPIHSAYLIHRADFVACHNPVYLHKYFLMAEELKEEGSLLLNCGYRDEELEEYLPDAVKALLAKRHIRLYTIDALAIDKEIGLNGKINTVLQAAFFAVTKLLPPETAKERMKAAAAKSYGKLGEKILQMNYEAIERGFAAVRERKVPEGWAALEPSENVPSGGDPLDNAPLPGSPELLSYVENLQQPITDQRANRLPVSAFLPYRDGTLPAGSSAHERRNVATEMPVWKPENCIQCNLCSYVCPHAVIRPAVMTKEEAAQAPEGMKTLPMMGMPDYTFAVTVSQVDCTGCGSCAGVCPGKQGKKALEMVPAHLHEERQQDFDYAKGLPEKEDAVRKFKETTVKGSQFLRPLLEFHGACAGCGETPYVKLLTQLFGKRMYIANATGCSSIWAASLPTTAYTTDPCGRGPAWSNSLFEDAAEFGYGMLMAQKIREEDTIQWVIGGDGWAYDIGFGGLDHVLASGADINILVLDTEVYSNTGGQASKATPLGSTAAFVTGGKTTPKKNLAAMALTYGNVYVAQIAMGADYAQTLKALAEAAAYPGPSLVVAYATCIAHGIKAGLGSSQHEEKRAVEAGYFPLFRFNPSLREEGKNPFMLDSHEPSLSYEEFLAGEVRYTALEKSRPEEARRLFRLAADQAKERFRQLQKLVELYETFSS